MNQFKNAFRSGRGRLASAAVMVVAGVAASASGQATFNLISPDVSDGVFFSRGTISGVATDRFAASSRRMDLVVDADGTGPAAARVFSVRTVVDASFKSYERTDLGGLFQHRSLLNGTIGFVGADGSTILSIAFGRGMLESVSDSATTLGSFATLRSLADAPVVFTPSGPLADMVLAGDESFELTLGGVVATVGGTAPTVSTVSGLPTQAWRSGGSFVGQAVPNAGSLALLGVGGALLLRRRRTA